ncbi:MAG: hypothetical protein HY695_01575 [Deltaproteobacteria bacterium]|nr:hypothetical protein [Deltaproteobacteria bacterium]
MRDDQNDNRIDTTLGDIIEAVSEVAFEYSENANEAYTLARLVLNEILKNAYSTNELYMDFPGSKYLH